MSAKQVTKNEAKMKQISAELENIQASLQSDIAKMRELVESCKAVWTDESITSYIKSYEKKEPDLSAISKVIQECAAALSEISDEYAKADMQALDAIKSTMGGR